MTFTKQQEFKANSFGSCNCTAINDRDTPNQVMMMMTTTTTNPMEAEFDSSKRSAATEYENNPDKVVPVRIDTTAPQDVCHAQILRVVDTLCPFLTDSSDSTPENRTPDDLTALSIRSLTGGLSNHLFLVSNHRLQSSSKSTDTSSNTVLVRIHPESGDSDVCQKNQPHRTIQPSSSFSIVDREVENRFAAWLATQKSTCNKSDDSKPSPNKLAPTVYGRFTNGRVEEFYDHVRPLSSPEMKLYALYIAPQLAAFHLLPDPSENVLKRPKQQVATIYETLDTWLQEATRLLSSSVPNPNDGNREEELALLSRLREEWKWLRQELSQPMSSDDNVVAQAYDFIRRVAVTHMDCQPLNILVDQNAPTPGATTSSIENGDDKKINLRLIDFEYSGWNPVAADIANTFCEYCEMSNLKANYEIEYPSSEQQEDFFWHYCATYKKRNSHLSVTLPEDRDGDDWKAFSNALQHEVGRFSLLSHLGWAVWSVIKSKEEDGVDFDYIFYANHRMEGFNWAKAKFCA